MKFQDDISNMNTYIHTYGQAETNMSPLFQSLGHNRAGRDDVTTGKLFPNRGECLGLYRCVLIIFKRK